MSESWAVPRSRIREENIEFHRGVRFAASLIQDGEARVLSLHILPSATERRAIGAGEVSLSLARVTPAVLEKWHRRSVRAVADDSLFYFRWLEGGDIRLVWTFPTAGIVMSHYQVYPLETFGEEIA